MALGVVMLLDVVATLGGGVVATLCCRPIILCTVQGYFWRAQQRSDAIRVMRPDH
jgi:hypothetical protein